MRPIMGTNYYWLPPHPLSPPVHIGKSSAGWCFALHVYPTSFPDMDGREVQAFRADDWDDWQELFDVKHSFIRDEYGEIISKEKFIAIVTVRAWRQATQPHTKQWYEENSAIEGPFGLNRHAINAFCIAHGSGTWDCCVGDFT